MTKVYSMASNDVVIPVYKAKKGKEVGENKIDKAVIIKGRANVRDPKTLTTPKWGVTEVTKEELEILQANPAFKRKVEAGFIVVGKEPAELKADKAAQLTKDSPQVKNVKGAKVKTNDENESED